MNKQTKANKICQKTNEPQVATAVSAAFSMHNSAFSIVLFVRLVWKSVQFVTIVLGCFVSALLRFKYLKSIEKLRTKITEPSYCFGRMAPCVLQIDSQRKSLTKIAQTPSNTSLSAFLVLVIMFLFIYFGSASNIRNLFFSASRSLSLFSTFLSFFSVGIHLWYKYTITFK